MSASQCSSLLLPTSADVRSAGDVIAFDRPQGWLGIMLGNHLYYDLHGAVLSNEHRLEAKLKQLTKEIEQYSPSGVQPQTQTPIDSGGGGGGVGGGGSNVGRSAPAEGLAVAQNARGTLTAQQCALKSELAWLDSNASVFDRETCAKLKACIVEQWCQSYVCTSLRGLHVDGILSTVQLELLTQRQQNGVADAGGGGQAIGMFGACVAAIAGIALGVCLAVHAPTTRLN